ncbi:nucleotidyltransferase family protein [Gramella sp. GC03-9]|uniref:Nucleotidyltransferase family protein n=1 Tax=Christiangramia oceanisediminis TaxID=2920386 RepID=A0A9X2I9K8_9FLAO|nr:nucleotidyltransferase family protein [Gramella oceanisediminis]MCP9199956.1 nucleotidyltransferase family protein [Gramella oceanisediminis]
MNEKSKIGVLILAAGSSSRLGHPKQLVEFKAKSLLQHAIDAVKDLPLQTKVLVLGARSTMIQEEVETTGFKIVLNPKWEEGMASSIRIGLGESLKMNPDLEHLVILVSDQPFITSREIEELLKAHLKNEKEATFSEYASTVGVPAVFSAKLFSELEKLKGDQGAKKLISALNLDLQSIPIQKGNFDVDTPEDVKLLKQME